MKAIPLVVLSLLAGACATAPVVEAPRLRRDVLYYADSEGGRRAAQEVTTLFGGRQEVAVVAFPLPKITPPIPGARSLPIYPPELKESRVDGEVTVDFIVDENGSVVYAAVVKSSHPGLDAAAVAAVRSWKFTPAKRSGESVRSRLQVPLWFKHES